MSLRTKSASFTFMITEAGEHKHKSIVVLVLQTMMLVAKTPLKDPGHLMPIRRQATHSPRPPNQLQFCCFLALLKNAQKPKKKKSRINTIRQNRTKLCYVRKVKFDISLYLSSHSYLRERGFLRRGGADAEPTALLLLLPALGVLGLGVLVAVVVVVGDAELAVAGEAGEVALGEGHALDLLDGLALGAHDGAGDGADDAGEADEEARRP